MTPDSGVAVASRQTDDLREDGHNRNVARVHCEHKDDADEVPDDTINLVALLDTHEEAAHHLPDLGECRRVEPDHVDSEDERTGRAQILDEGRNGRGVEAVEREREKA